MMTMMTMNIPAEEQEVVVVVVVRGDNVGEMNEGVDGEKERTEAQETEEAENQEEERREMLKWAAVAAARCLK